MQTLTLFLFLLVDINSGTAIGPKISKAVLAAYEIVDVQRAAFKIKLKPPHNSPIGKFQYMVVPFGSQHTAESVMEENGICGGEASFNSNQPFVRSVSCQNIKAGTYDVYVAVHPKNKTPYIIKPMDGFEIPDVPHAHALVAHSPGEQQYSLTYDVDNPNTNGKIYYFTVPENSPKPLVQSLVFCNAELSKCCGHRRQTKPSPRRTIHVSCPLDIGVYNVWAGTDTNGKGSGFVWINEGEPMKLTYDSTTPTKFPSLSPSKTPTLDPSSLPTTSKPSKSPVTSFPSPNPTTDHPSGIPTPENPTIAPTNSSPSKAPTNLPTTGRPSISPSSQPTVPSPTTAPTIPTPKPTHLIVIETTTSVMETTTAVVQETTSPVANPHGNNCDAVAFDMCVQRKTRMYESRRHKTDWATSCGYLIGLVACATDNECKHPSEWANWKDQLENCQNPCSVGSLGNTCHIVQLNETGMTVQQNCKYLFRWNSCISHTGCHMPPALKEIADGVAQCRGLKKQIRGFGQTCGLPNLVCSSQFSCQDDHHGSKRCLCPLQCKIFDLECDQWNRFPQMCARDSCCYWNPFKRKCGVTYEIECSNFFTPQLCAKVPCQCMWNSFAGKCTDHPALELLPGVLKQSQKAPESKDSDSHHHMNNVLIVLAVVAILGCMALSVLKILKRRWQSHGERELGLDILEGTRSI